MQATWQGQVLEPDITQNHIYFLKKMQVELNKVAANFQGGVGCCQCIAMRFPRCSEYLCSQSYLLLGCCISWQKELIVLQLINIMQNKKIKKKTPTN